MDSIAEKAEKLIKKLDIASKKKRILELETESMSPGFWNNHQIAADKMKELSNLQKEVEELDLLKLWIDEGEFEEAKKLLKKLELLLYFSSDYDNGSAILSIHSGQGATEAMDWAEMLFRMYSRYAEKRGWSVDVIDQTVGEEAGLKSVVMTINGQYAYGTLKFEAGTHRLVRQSPFNADKLRQTSFALVEVMPVIENDSDL